MLLNVRPPSRRSLLSRHDHRFSACGAIGNWNNKALSTALSQSNKRALGSECHSNAADITQGDAPSERASPFLHLRDTLPALYSTPQEVVFGWSRLGHNQCCRTSNLSSRSVPGQS